MTFRKHSVLALIGFSVLVLAGCSQSSGGSGPEPNAADKAAMAAQQQNAAGQKAAAQNAAGQRATGQKASALGSAAQGGAAPAAGTTGQ